MSESMRACFYEGSWDQESCEKNALFLSQGNYPIKGAHYILEALPEIAKEIPDVKLYIAGDNIIKNKKKTSLSRVFSLIIHSFGLYSFFLLIK